MEVSEFAKEIEKIKAAIEKAAIKGIEKEVSNFVLKYIDDNIKREGGKYILDAKSRIALRRFNNALEQFIIKNKGVEDYIVKTIKNIDKLSNTYKSFYRSNGVNIRNIKNPLNISIDTMVNGLKGIGVDYQNPLRQLITRNLVSNASRTDMEADILKSVKSRGGIASKARILARFASNAGSGLVAKQVWDENKDNIKFVGVTGTIIETSAPQCIICIKEKGVALDFEEQTRDLSKYDDKGYLGRVPLSDFKNIILPLAEKNGLVEGTDIDNIWLNTLHYNCRHSFFPLAAGGLAERIAEKRKNR